ncbi:hypothetical protein BP5796_03885 [Coleophoma crateriformis]|uniref:Extracellular membrane protein CFEM domain-containing protein n=1 Tax=Coleophoma crateriformis TaxID=565419 RepID=A0A3D8SGV4_9HELO|nr:hypothetical protein BP5796_03885 [Coleophoma crateriformis]
MQFSLIAGITSAVLIGTSLASPLVEKRTVVEECKAANDCCFSTINACRRQASVLEANVICRILDFCPSMGVSFADCNADCCSISRKAGRGCPGK